MPSTLIYMDLGDAQPATTSHAAENHPGAVVDDYLNPSAPAQAIVVVSGRSGCAH